MKFMKFIKKASLFFAYAFPSIPVIIIAIETVFAMIAKAAGDTWLALTIAFSLVSMLNVVTPLCGCAGMVFSLMAKHRLGKKKCVTAAIIWNALTLVLAILLLSSAQ